MEPERKIEKVLRAFAKKRRNAAGVPLELHPAARRMLQAEVARRAKDADDEESTISLWQFFRRDWAFLAGFALLIFFVATMTLPSLSSAKKKAKNIMAINNLKQIGAAARMAADENDGKLPGSLDMLTNGFLADKTLTDPQTGKPFVYIAGGENLAELHSNNVLAYSENENSPLVLFADGNVGRADREQFAELTNRRLQMTVAESENRGGEPMSNALAANGAHERATNGVDLNGINSYGSTLNNGTPAAAPASSPPSGNYFTNTQSSLVLNRFQLQQNGATIAIRDNDGSIYSGLVMPQNKDLSARHQLAESISFRVTGTNATSNQKIVFDGNLIVISNTVSGGTIRSGGDQFRILGTATINGTNRIPVDASAAQ